VRHSGSSRGRSGRRRLTPFHLRPRALFPPFPSTAHELYPSCASLSRYRRSGSTIFSRLGASDPSRHIFFADVAAAVFTLWGFHVRLHFFFLFFLQKGMRALRSRYETAPPSAGLKEGARAGRRASRSFSTLFLPVRVDRGFHSHLFRRGDDDHPFSVPFEPG